MACHHTTSWGEEGIHSRLKLYDINITVINKYKYKKGVIFIFEVNMYYLLAKTALCQFLGSISAKVWEFDPPGGHK